MIPYFAPTGCVCRHAFFVGDMLIKRDVLKLRTLAPKVNVINMYGSTETQRAVGYYEGTLESLLRLLEFVFILKLGKHARDPFSSTLTVSMLRNK